MKVEEEVMMSVIVLTTNQDIGSFLMSNLPEIFYLLEHVGAGAPGVALGVVTVSGDVVHLRHSPARHHAVPLRQVELEVLRVRQADGPDVGELVEVHGSLQLQQGHVISDESLSPLVGKLRLGLWAPLGPGCKSHCLSLPRGVVLYLKYQFRSLRGLSDP